MEWTDVDWELGALLGERAFLEESGIHGNWAEM